MHKMHREIRLGELMCCHRLPRCNEGAYFYGEVKGEKGKGCRKEKKG